MKKHLLLFFIFCFNSSFGGWEAFAQNPLVKMWDKRFGGTSADWLNCFQQTSDGGYILGGHSVSTISGDKTQDTCTLSDYWIVKIDSLGNKQWDRDFGGNSYDDVFSVEQTFDGGYVLCGYSVSQISCDKTQANWGISDVDYWIVRIDSIGNKIWDRRFGGTGYDYPVSIIQTADSGFIVGGYSMSGLSGDKTQPSQGLTDYWIVKIDASGNKQWDKRYGGTSNDWLLSLTLTSDKGYLLGGASTSGIGGDKTESSRSIVSNARDYWVIKIDSIGNIEWDKTFGGDDEDWLYSLIQTHNGNYILCGFSYSTISGDKTVSNWGSAGTSDIWLIRIDSLGNKIWDKNYGGIYDEESQNGVICLTLDGGFMFSCQSYSPISGDKTENNMGNEQTWVVKLDSLGNKQWDKTLLTDCGTNDDEVGSAIQTRDGCYAIANCTTAGIGGDKSQNRWGPITTEDFWIAKFCETLQANFTSLSSICPGTCIDFTNLSFQATSYQWSFPFATPDTSSYVNPQNICYPTPGSYDVQLIATNANGSDTLFLSNYITVYPTPPPQSITQNGDTLFAIAGAATYQWYYNTSIINGATNYFYVALASGDFNVVCTDVNGCEVEAAVFNIVAYAEFPVYGLQFTVYPNPVSEKLEIRNLKLVTAATISIYNMLGVSVAQSEIKNPNPDSYRDEMSVDVSALSSDMYWIEIISREKNFRTKFVKQ